MCRFYGLTPVHNKKKKKKKKQVVNQIWLTLKIPIIWLNKWLKTNDLINLWQNQSF